MAEMNPFEKLNLPGYADPIQTIGIINDLLENNLRRLLNNSYFPRSYDGVVKPVLGGDFGSLSKKNWTNTLSDSISVNVGTAASRGVVVVGRQSSANTSLDDLIRTNRFVIDIEFGNADYWYYVNYGRRPGVEITKRSVKQPRSKKTGRFMRKRTYTSYTKMPPLKNIQQWVETKPALVNNELSVETRTYLAMRSIARDGIYGINFVEKAIAETYPQVEGMMGSAIADWFARKWVEADFGDTRIGYVKKITENPIRKR